jgi:AraC family transcriptional regulator
MARLAAEVVTPGFASGAVIESLTTLMIVDTMRALGHGPAKEAGVVAKGGLTSFQLRRIDERIRDDTQMLPTVADLAMELGFSVRHLLRAYRQATGSTLRTCVQRSSHDRAMALLSGTNLPLKTIAYRLGFQSPGSFSTAFRNVMGETPSAFRRRQGH